MPAHWAAGEHDRELLTDLVVAGVVEDVFRIGVDADETGDLAVDAGFFLRLAYAGLRERLAQVDSTTGEGPVAVVGSAAMRFRAMTFAR